MTNIHKLIACLILFLALICIYFIWLHYGFDFKFPKNIIYLFYYLAKEKNLPAFIIYPLALLLLPLAYCLIMTFNSNIINHQNVHGDSRWANFNDVMKAGLNLVKYPNELFKNQADGAVIGGYKKYFFSKTQLICHNGAEHIICFAPTRMGKGVSLIIPTLMTWLENSVLVLDIKAENYNLTAGFRAKMGQKIIKFEPTNPNECHKFNPLAEIRFGTEYEFSDVQNIAMIIMDTDGKGLGNDYWSNSGWIWMTTAILHCCHRWQLEKNIMPSLADVYNYINADSSLESGGGLIKILNNMMKFDHKNPFINDNIRRGAGVLLSKAEAERSGVHSSGSVKLGLFVDPTIAKNTATSDWTIDELMDGDMPVSCYLIIAPPDIDRLKPLIRIFMTMLVAKRTSRMNFTAGEQDKSYKYKLLLLLDEFPSIGKILVLENAISFVAGYGLKLYIICQDLNQLYAKYSKDESITANCHIQIALAPNTVNTAEYIEKRLGNMTVQLKNTSSSTSKNGTAYTISYQSHKVPLKNSSQIQQLPLGQMLIMIARSAPILAKQPFFYKNKILNARSKIPIYFHPLCPITTKDTP